MMAHIDTTTQATNTVASWIERLAQRPGVTATVYGCGHSEKRYSSVDLDRTPEERLTDGGPLCGDCARRLEEDR